MPWTTSKPPSANRLSTKRVLLGVGGVDTPQVQRGGELLAGLIRGTARAPVRAYVRVLDQADGVAIRGECSCPRRADCEHVAALLLKALESEPPGIAPTPAPKHAAGAGMPAPRRL